jgi:hypothetical protein
MAAATFEDKAKDAGWNALTAMPLVGSVANGAALGTDLYTFATESGEAQNQAFRDVAADGLGFVPLIGTGLGLGSIAYDIVSSDDTAGNLVNRMLGGEDKYPSAVDQFDTTPIPPPTAPYAPFDEDDFPIVGPDPSMCEE